MEKQSPTNGTPSGSHSSYRELKQSAPMHRQTQAFWSADKRKRSEAVENRTA